MATTLKGELTERRGGLSGGKGSRSRRFIVVSDNKSDFESTVFATTGLPKYNNLHPDDPTLRARGFNAEQDREAWWKWIVTVDYEEPSPSSDPDANQFDNPLDKPPEIETYTDSIMVTARGEVDASGNLIKAIKNSADEPYDPAPEEELDVMVIQISRFAIADFSVSLYQQYNNAVNDAAWTFGDKTFAEGQVKIKIRIGPALFWRHPETGASFRYREYVFELFCIPHTWDIELLDWGTSYLDGATRKRFIDEPQPGTGNEFGLLDGSGGKLGPTDEPVWLKWKNKKRVAFGPLNLPSGP